MPKSKVSSELFILQCRWQWLSGEVAKLRSRVSNFDRQANKMVEKSPVSSTIEEVYEALMEMPDWLKGSSKIYSRLSLEEITDHDQLSFSTADGCGAILSKEDKKEKAVLNQLWDVPVDLDDRKSVLAHCKLLDQRMRNLRLCMSLSMSVTEALLTNCRRSFQFGTC